MLRKGQKKKKSSRHFPRTEHTTEVTKVHATVTTRKNERTLRETERERRERGTREISFLLQSFFSLVQQRPTRSYTYSNAHALLQVKESPVFPLFRVLFLSDLGPPSSERFSPFLEVWVVKHQTYLYWTRNKFICLLFLNLILPELEILDDMLPLFS